VVIACGAPAPPKVSETFNATVKIQIETADGKQSGEGIWGTDQHKGKVVELYTFPGSLEIILQRYDLGFAYKLVNDTCSKNTLYGDLPSNWNWLASANYTGRKTIEKREFDIWQKTFGYITLILAVSPDKPTLPVWFFRFSVQRNHTIFFTQFKNEAPRDHFFEVPPKCQNAMDTDDSFDDSLDDSTDNSTDNMISPNACVSRKTIITRAEEWVKHKVPYNQGGTYGGYREDCSGFVSMAWGLAKPGHTTFTLPQVSKKISKADLKEGDILLYSAEHVVIFGGWADSAKTKYIAYEESRPGVGTVKRTTPYPYWYNTAKFFPYRYNSVC